jgi:SUMO ligase MMS21 Smc5/6 complex component
MARKATKKTDNKVLIRHILDDQTSLFVPHLSHSEALRNRLHHNITELYRRLGETVDDDEFLFYE